MHAQKYAKDNGKPPGSVRDPTGSDRILMIIQWTRQLTIQWTIPWTTQWTTQWTIQWTIQRTIHWTTQWTIQWTMQKTMQWKLPLDFFILVPFWHKNWQMHSRGSKLRPHLARWGHIVVPARSNFQILFWIENGPHGPRYLKRQDTRAKRYDTRYHAHQDTRHKIHDTRYLAR